MIYDESEDTYQLSWTSLTTGAPPDMLSTCSFYCCRFYSLFEEKYDAAMQVSCWILLDANSVAYLE